MPQQYEVIDVKDQGSSSLSGAGDAILRVFQAEELFHVAEAHFQRPAQGEGFEDLRRLQREVGGEETIVAAVAARIAHYDDAQKSRPGAGIPQRVDGLVTDLDLATIDPHRGLDPGPARILRHLLGAGQTPAFCVFGRGLRQGLAASQTKRPSWRIAKILECTDGPWFTTMEFEAKYLQRRPSSDLRDRSRQPGTAPEE